LFNEPILHFSREPNDDLGRLRLLILTPPTNASRLWPLAIVNVNVKVATGHVGSLMSSDFPSRGLDKFVLRLPEGMRDKIGVAARTNKRTMNAEIIQRLDASFSSTNEPLQVVKENTAEADMFLELKSLRAEFAELTDKIGVSDFAGHGTAIRETRRIVGELLEAVKALTKSICPGDRSKKD